MKNAKKLVVDFLYLDLSKCDRCQATDTVLDEALFDLRDKLTNVTINKIRVAKDEVDDSFRSPTIRINGKDIEEILHDKFKIKEDQKDNECGPCSELCGEGTRCRVYEYKGKDYNALPKEMIQEAIAKVVGFELSIEKARSTKACCADGNVAKSKAEGCGCGSGCCADGKITQSKAQGCGCD